MTVYRAIPYWAHIHPPDFLRAFANAPIINDQFTRESFGIEDHPPEGYWPLDSKEWYAIVNALPPLDYEPQMRYIGVLLIRWIRNKVGAPTFWVSVDES
jgi:hypothetical protein